MKQFSKLFIILVLVIVGLGGYVYVEESGEQDLEFIALDVGQGDAILIRTPFKQNILIDGGPDKGVVRGIDRHLPFWRRKIDLMILTHPDADHVTGLVEVLERYPVARVMGTGVVHTLPAYIEWLEIIKEEGIPFEIAWARMTVELGDDLRMEILWPVDDYTGTNVEDNNKTSIVVKLVYGDTSFLLMGDATVEVEASLLVQSVFSLAADVLKVGHHGSKDSTSLEFVKLVKPEYAVISVGKDNRFGHPSRRVTKNLDEVGAVILRTDEVGDVLFRSDGTKVTYERDDE